jgi:hypothetical protein
MAITNKTVRRLAPRALLPATANRVLAYPASYADLRAGPAF